MNYLDLATRIAKADLEKINKFQYRKNYVFGAVCIRYDGTIAVSNNILTKIPNPNAHAEKRVLYKSGFDAKALYIVRITKHGNWAIAKPCNHCEQLIFNKRVRKVIYSVEPGVYQVWKP